MAAVHDREPFPLYPLLAEHGYRHATRTRMEADGSYYILIRPAREVR